MKISYVNKKVIFIVLSVVVLFSFVAVKNQNREYSVTIYDAMDTFSSIRISGGKDAKEAILECEKIIYKYDKMLSPTKPDSQIYKLNNADSEVKVLPEVMDLIYNCKSFYEDTNGKFDITIGALSSLWSDTFLKETIPDDREIKALAEITDYSGLLIDKDNQTIKKASPKQQISLGSVAKGYIADRIYEYLDNKNIKDVTVDLGGNIYVSGKKRNGENQKVGIQDPNDTDNIVGTVSIEEGFVVTSGDYQRGVQIGDVRYHHLLDAKTGYPANNGLRSVTIVSKNGFLADALSTACFLSGLEDGAELSKKYGVDAIFITDDKIYYSKNLESVFDKTSQKYNYEEI